MKQNKYKVKQFSRWQEGALISSQVGRRGFQVIGGGDYAQMRFRVRVASSIFLITLIGLISRLIYLGILEKGRYQLTAEVNNLEQIREYAPRGIIRDRLGRELVRNIAEKGRRGREYLLGKSGAHLLGYLSEVKEDELGCRQGRCYFLGDWIGRAGVEREFEASLKGKDGGKVVEVDVAGKEIRELGENKAEQGEDLELSVDRDLQKIVAEAMHDRDGSVVALDMQGKVLAIYSSPAYDPNLFTVNPNEGLKQKLLADKQAKYFLNRAIGGVYAPGSVFKLVTAYAGLESGKIDKDTLIEDTGEIVIDKYRYGNWYYDQYGKTEGEINVIKALARSNDIFFYKVGEKVGVDSLVEWSHKLGLGEKTGIELSGEKIGLVPDRLWKERVVGERWFLGNTYHLAIGQGDLGITPIQVARMTLAAVSGRVCRVSILAKKEVECKNIGVKTENIEIVKEGMKSACAKGGTAFPLFDVKPYAICKTGTAQHAGQKTDSDLPHAWITLAYPGENPKFVLTVMLDSAGEGSAEAGPIAREILDRWKGWE